ncbi:lanthionine synthetase C family protein [Lactiplantibacillus sp. DA1]|uniref:lanthionine synthetase C family protein n=1 Tax=Lactiplantibacillus sp. DA1 TaxID=3079857 RepID=UPI00292A66F7|nr:lanthionine synthetase C family protein [Lactiplantibacillus sp. DA1]MDV0430278.1 lanthionine synthetase C family protein [Lactiplantibacillus sp. DA1]
MQNKLDLSFIDEVKQILNTETEKYLNVDSLFKISSSVDTRTDFWNPVTLSSGLSGILLLLKEREVTNKVDLSETIFSYVQSIVRNLDPKNVDISMFSGLTGIAFAISQVSHQRQNYSNILDQLDSRIIQLVPRFLSNNCVGKTNPGIYDVVQGYSGIGRYLLSISNQNKNAKALLIQILHLIENEQLSKVGELCWWVPNEFQFLKRDKELYPNGNLNFGLAHGMLGPMSLYALSSKQGIKTEKCEQTLKSMYGYLMSFSQKDTTGYTFPMRLAVEQVSIINTLNNYVKNGWCYGNTDFYNTLYLIGSALHDKEILATSTKVLVSILNQSDSDLISPTFCHGLSGHLAFLLKAYDRTPSDYLMMKIDEIVQRIFSFYKSSNVYGFQDIETDESQQYVFNNFGLLNGEIGILLVLSDYLAVKSESNGKSSCWSNVFCLD